MAKTKSLKNFDFGNATDTGLVREVNEDYMTYFESVNGHVFIVCDGMGGHVGGATASRLAVDNARAFLENHYFSEPAEALHASIEYANTAVFNNAMNNPVLAGMGTTIVMVLVRDDKAWYAHVGDSRIYLFTNKKLHRLTRDHSYVDSLVEQGLISEEDAEQHPRKNEILRALGVGRKVVISVAEIPVVPAKDDIMLLCSDGLTGMVKDDAIRAVLAENLPIQHKAMTLVQMANDNGGHDNTTVQLIYFYAVNRKNAHFAGITTVSEEPKEKKPETFMKKNLKIIMIALGALFLAYIVWDLFIHKGEISRFNSMPSTVTDSTAGSQKDTTKTVTPAQKKDTVIYEYKVKKGEVLGVISAKFRVKIDVLKKLNNLKNDNIGEGKKLKIPVKALYTIKTGGSLDVLARDFDVPKEAIMKANDLNSDKEVKPGQLVIPF
jgi:serine/threonine protein phosphatase PrpC/LysM repeat protein